MHRLAFSVHEFLFSVELIKMCLQVKLGVYCSEHLWESVPFSPLALCITSLSPSNDFLSPALLLVFHPVQALSSFPFSSKDKPIFHFLFCLMCSPISLKWQGRFMEFEVWALFAFFSFSFSGKMTKKSFTHGELILVENDVDISSRVFYGTPKGCLAQPFFGIIYSFHLWPLHIHTASSKFLLRPSLHVLLEFPYSLRFFFFWRFA